MTKTEFLEALRTALPGLPPAELEERSAFYSEMIEDRMEEGMTEADAVAAVGPMEDIIAHIAAEVPLGKLVRQSVKPSRDFRTWEIALLVLGFPVWLPLLIAAFAVVLSLYIALWAVVISFWAVVLSLAVGGLGSLVAAAAQLVTGELRQTAFLLGLTLAAAGLAILMFFGCAWLTKVIARSTKSLVVQLKTRLIRKEA